MYIKQVIYESGGAGYHCLRVNLLPHEEID